MEKPARTVEELVETPSIFGKPLARAFTILFLVLLFVLPLFAWYTGNRFYLDFATRLVCLGIAAVSLNLILGFGGMVSFGHAVFLGIGAYCVGIPAYYGYESGFLHVPLAVGMSALFALVTGAISLRTKGVYFIMITMAFAQMAFYFFVSLEEYGGDDGLTLYNRSTFGSFSIENKVTFFVLCCLVLVTTTYLVFRLVHSRFGMVIRGAQSNEGRMRALGYNVYLYRLTAYVIAGSICGLAGALLGNFQSFISPDMMAWTRSGELMFMVILGGAGSIFGPLFGVVAFVVIEEVLSSFTAHWALPFGILLILAVLFVKGGLNGLLQRIGR